MIRSEIVLTIPGTPAPKGSLRCRRNPAHTLYEDNPKTKPWREWVRDAAKQVTQHADKGQPLSVEVSFTLERPPSVPKSRRYPSVKPDVDKLVRTVLDALEDATVLVNDSQVVELVARKRYATDEPNYDDALAFPGVRIRINPL